MGTKVIWDGKNLPPIGCKVLINLASKGADKFYPYEVTGYDVRPPMKDQAKFDQPWLYVVAIKLKSGSGENERFLNECFPLDHGVNYVGN